MQYLTFLTALLLLPALVVTQNTTISPTNTTIEDPIMSIGTVSRTASNASITGSASITSTRFISNSTTTRGNATSIRSFQFASSSGVVEPSFIFASSETTIPTVTSIVVVGVTSATPVTTAAATTTSESELVGDGSGAGELKRVGGSMGAFAVALGVVVVGRMI